MYHIMYDIDKGIKQARKYTLYFFIFMKIMLLEIAI